MNGKFISFSHAFVCLFIMEYYGFPTPQKWYNPNEENYSQVKTKRIRRVLEVGNRRSLYCMEKSPLRLYREPPMGNIKVL